MSLPPNSPTPYLPPRQVPTSQGYFSDAGPYAASASPFQAGAPRRGMFGQVKVVAILNIIQGVMELMLSLAAGVAGGAFYGMRGQMIADMQRSGEPNAELTVSIMTYAAAAVAAILFVTSLLRLISGARNLVFRSRVMAIVSLFTGLISCFTFYCAPTSLAIAVYGLIVFFNREVGEAFEMRNRGASSDDVVRAFNARPY